MKQYVEKCGLTTSYDINGIKTAAGSFEFPDDADLNLAWAGIGQWKDELNPCSMMVYMGAIARGGKAIEPKLIHSVLPTNKETSRMIDESTASKLTDMPSMAFATVGANDVAKIGDTGYATLEDAVTAANNGDTITMVNNYDFAQTITISKSITLDLNGKTIKNTKTSDYAGSTAMYVQGGSLTVNDSATGGKIYSEFGCGINVYGDYTANHNAPITSTLVINKAIIDAQEYGIGVHEDHRRHIKSKGPADGSHPR